MAYKEKANAIKYNNKFIADKYDRINLTVPKGRKAELQAFVEQHGHGQSVNGFINSLIDEALKRELVGVVHDDLPAGGAGAEGEQRAPKGAGGGDDAAGEVSIFPDGEATPHAPVGVSPTQGEESSPLELSPDDWAVWAHRHDDESLEEWRARLNRSNRSVSSVDIMKRMGKLPHPERDLAMGTDPESMERFRQQEERKRKQEEQAAQRTGAGDLPF